MHLFRLLWLVLGMMTVLCRAESDALPLPPALPERLISIATSAEASGADRAYLESLSKAFDPEGVAVTAALYRHWPETFQARFVDMFRQDLSLPAEELSREETNARVNAVLKRFQGRHPLEVSARLYARFRRSGCVAKGASGLPLSLEVMFRSAVFAGISGDDTARRRELIAVADDAPATLPLPQKPD